MSPQTDTTTNHPTPGDINDITRRVQKIEAREARDWLMYALVGRMAVKDWSALIEEVESAERVDGRIAMDNEAAR